MDCGRRACDRPHPRGGHSALKAELDRPPERRPPSTIADHCDGPFHLTSMAADVPHIPLVAPAGCPLHGILHEAAKSGMFHRMLRVSQLDI